MNETKPRTSTEDEVYRLAYALYSQKPDWVTFFREIFGLKGVVRRKYLSPAQLDEFERTDTCAEIKQLLAKLRKRKAVGSGGEEPTRVITVRLPKSLHEALRVEAHDHRTSLNQLCISKLLQFIENDLVPTD